MEFRLPPELAEQAGGILEIAQAAADFASVNALNEIAQWLHHDKAQPELAQELLKTFGAPSEDDDASAEALRGEGVAGSQETSVSWSILRGDASQFDTHGNVSDGPRPIEDFEP